jgi:precorrin-2/cobalt-factor-2 C20-methyltransferase
MAEPRPGDRVRYGRGLKPRSRWGVLYGLGLGPGDSELVTLKTRRIMRSVATLLVPVRSADDEPFVWKIAEPHLTSRRQRVVRLPFPQERGDPALDEQWARHAATVIELLAASEDAAFLTEGDPLLYSSFTLLACAVRAAAPDLPIAIVPGVTSITAAAAAAGQPLVSRGGRLAVLPALYGLDELAPVLRDFDTIVLLKVNRRLAEIVGLLEAHGLADGAFLVERCGRPEQRVVRGLGDFAGPVDYFSLVVVRR